MDSMSKNLSKSDEEFEFPKNWGDSSRIAAYFAPFRSKSLNPEFWDIKMKFWTDLIESWCKYNKCSVTKISILKSSFTRMNSVPVCLEEVFHFLKGKGVVIEKETFLTLNDSWGNWAFKVLFTNPLKRAFSTVKNTIIKQSENEETYVHLPTVKYLGEELVEKFSSASRKIYNFDDLVNLSCVNSENLSVVLCWMQRQGWAAVIHENDCTLVKIGNRKGKVIITETDLGIYHLEKQEKLLKENLIKLTDDRNAALEETKAQLAAKNKSFALMSLRRKKELEKIMEKRAITLENIQALLLKIDQAKLDIEVVECYQKGIATLKQIYKETGLSAESVTETMDELEVCLSRNEIEEALERSMDPSLEAELEEELNELLVEDAPEVPEDKLPTESPRKKKKEKNDLNLRMEALSL